MPPPDTVESLREDLSSTDLRVRVGALNRLSKLGGDDAVDAMIESLRTSDSVTVGWAARYLSQIGAKGALPSLLTTLQERGGDLDGPSKDLVIMALGTLGDASTVPTLEPFLCDPRYLTRRAAALAIATIPGPESRISLELAERALSLVRGLPIRRALRGMRKREKSGSDSDT